jgi:LemA protein
VTDTTWLLIGVAAVLGFWMLGAYNRVMSLRAPILVAWTQLEGVLQARSQVIAELLTTVERALASERAALDATSLAQKQLMAAVDLVRPRPVRREVVAALAQSEVAMVGAMARLTALVEQQAMLRSEPAAATSLQALHDLQPRLAFARQVFNEAAGAYNSAVQQFPTSLLRRVFDFDEAGTL